jgi:hypothetical protein
VGMQAITQTCSWAAAAAAGMHGQPSCLQRHFNRQPGWLLAVAFSGHPRGWCTP